MKKFGLFVLLYILSTPLFGQVDLSFSGYISDFPIYMHYKEMQSQLFNVKQDQLINLTRIRLRPTLNLWSGARINIEYEIDALYSSSASSFNLSSPGMNPRQVVDLAWTPIKEEKYSVTHLIDRLSFRQGFDFGNITIGRQRISWGTGRVWNPTDLFNPINPATYYKIEKDGADAISGMFRLGNFTDLNLVFNFQEKLKDSNYGFRFRSNVNEFDFSFMGGHFDENLVIGGDFAGNLFDAGIRGEGIIYPNGYTKFILGIDYQFTPELYSLIEYQYNGEGITDKNQYDLYRLMIGDIINLSRNYIHISSVYQYTPLLIFTFSNNTNLNDLSGYLSLVGNYSLDDNFYINFGLQLFYGEEFTEYWYFPNSIYLQGEYYF